MCAVNRIAGTLGTCPFELQVVSNLDVCVLLKQREKVQIAFLFILLNV
jgi:hypothetical protein